MTQMGRSSERLSWKLILIVVFQESSELDQVLDHLLHRGESGDPEGEVVGEIIMETGMS